MTVRFSPKDEPRDTAFYDVKVWRTHNVRTVWPAQDDAKRAERVTRWIIRGTLALLAILGACALF